MFNYSKHLLRDEGRDTVFSQDSNYRVDFRMVEQTLEWYGHAAIMDQE